MNVMINQFKFSNNQILFYKNFIITDKSITFCVQKLEKKKEINVNTYEYRIHKYRQVTLEVEYQVFQNYYRHWCDYNNNFYRRQ